MWIVGEINGETVGTRVYEKTPYGVGHVIDAADGNGEVETATYADVFEKMEAVNDSGDDVTCRHCGVTVAKEDADDDDDDDDACPMHPEDGAHDWGPQPYAWFDKASIRLNEGPGEESVTASLTIRGRRFGVTAYLSEDGQLRLTQNDTSGTRGPSPLSATTHTEMIIAD